MDGRPDAKPFHYHECGGAPESRDPLKRSIQRLKAGILNETECPVVGDPGSPVMNSALPQK